MPYANNGNARIYYEVMGANAAPAILFIGGFTAQIFGWQDAFCQLFVDRGFQVIRFDNRDVGLSQQSSGTGGNEPGYTIHDMGRDGFAVLDDLGLERAHVVGQSMGGMIAQSMASARPERVLSLTLVYTAPWIDVEFLPPLADVPQMNFGRRTREEFIEDMLAGARVHSTSLYPIDEAWAREFARRSYDRAYTPEGVGRQLQAMLADLGTPFADSARLTMPVVLIHGRDDRQVHVSGSLELARRVPHAEVHLYPGMGHHFAEPLWSECCDVITRTARRAERESATAATPPRAPAADRPWLAAYPPGTPPEIDVSAHANVPSLLETLTAPFASQVAVSCGGERLSFAELHGRAGAWAAWLATVAGIRPGDRVAVMLGNGTAFPVVLLGCLKAGAVQVSVNPHYTARELQHQLRDSGARLLVAAAPAAAVALGVLDGTAVERVVVVGSEGSAPDSFDAALAQGASAVDWVPPTLRRESLALLQYTGGTTGLAKGAELTHGNLVANILQTRAWLGGALEPGRETILTALPLYHIFALTVNLLTFATFGTHNVLVPDARDTGALAEAFEREGISVVTGVNTLFAALLALPRLRDEHLRRVKLAIGGGAAVQRATSERWHARAGRHILEGYGLSETAPVLTINSYAEPRFTGTVGLPVPSTDLRIADAAGRPLAVGEQGEICVKGPQVMRGYWEQPQATAQAFTADGWFRTGDIGVLDPQGFVSIRDRKKDMVLVSGFNVYPNEIEGVIASLPGVAECAVAGVPDERTGEAVRAWVVRRDPALTEAKVLAHCREQLAAYKVPRRVELVASLPKSSVGKVLRRELRAEHAAVAAHAPPRCDDNASLA